MLTHPPTVLPLFTDLFYAKSLTGLDYTAVVLNYIAVSAMDPQSDLNITLS